MVELIADMLKAMGHPKRLAILHLLGHGERCVCEIWPQLDLAQPTASKHLAALRRAGLVCFRREGTKLIYKLAGPWTSELVEAVLAAGDGLERAGGPAAGSGQLHEEVSPG